MNNTSSVLSPVQPSQSTVVNVSPYVVSADIQVLLSKWASDRGFILPNGDFFPELRAEFCVLMRSVFPQFILISEQEVSEGLAEIVAETRHPLLSLERAYFKAPYQLEVSRCVNALNADVGLYARSGTPSLREQLAVLCAAGVKTVSIVDDVIFSGGFLLRILELLKKSGITVATVYTGIAIGSGMDKVRAQGYEIECVRSFPEVVDEVCERDFFPGVPLCGRTLRGAQNIGIPYIAPFGLMKDWASIAPEHESAVSKRCVELASLLFNEIGRMSERPVLCSDLERGVLGIPFSPIPFVAALQEFVR